MGRKLPSGLLRCNLPLIDKGQPKATYTVRLYFVANDKDGSRSRPFDIRLQDNTLVKAFDVRAAAGGPNKTLIKEFTAVEVERALKLELVPRTKDLAADQLPRLSAIEVLRTGAEEIRK